jgi:DNA-binding NarL/FixJ family response regulator
MNSRLGILDIRYAMLSGLGVARQVAKPGLVTRIIFLSFHRDEDFFRDAMETGGKGYLLKNSVTEEIVTSSDGF